MPRIGVGVYCPDRRRSHRDPNGEDVRIDRRKGGVVLVPSSRPDALAAAVTARGDG